MMNADRYLDIHNKYAAPIYRPSSRTFARGEGCRLWDKEGRTYLDVFACYSTLNQGHRHPRIVQAAKSQMDKLTLTGRGFLNEELPEFLEKLCLMSGMEQAVPMNSGAEAIETAVKVARKWGHWQKGIPRGKVEIIVMNNNFHGRTITAISFSTVKKLRDGFEPFTPGFVPIPFGDIAALEKAITRNTAAVILESIQAVNGINVPRPGYLEKLREATGRREILLILDEIQTGLGRTGKLFAWQWENAKPDILCLGKALGGGVYPVSAALSSKEIFSVLEPGDHGSTLAGNPLAAAVGTASLRVVEEENLSARAESAGNELSRELSKLKHPDIKQVKGKGLLLGLELNTNARAYVEKLLDAGIVSSTINHNIVRLTPPLIIRDDEISLLLDKLAGVFSV